MKWQMSLILTLGLLSPVTFAQTHGSRDSADNTFCRMLQSDSISVDGVAFESNDYDIMKLSEKLLLYANTSGAIQCYAQLLNTLGTEIGRGSEKTSRAMMVATTGLYEVIHDVVISQGEKGRSEIRRFLNQHLDMNGINYLAYAARSSNPAARDYGYLILTWVINSKNFCIIRKHIEVAQALKTEASKQGAENLLRLAEREKAHNPIWESANPGSEGACQRFQQGL